MKETLRFAISENWQRFARRSVSLTMWNGGHPRPTAIGRLKLASCGECLWYPHQRDKNGRSFWGVCCRSMFDNYGTNAVGRRKACFFWYFRQNGKTWKLQENTGWLIYTYTTTLKHRGQPGGFQTSQPERTRATRSRWRDTRSPWATRPESSISKTFFGVKAEQKKSDMYMEIIWNYDNLGGYLLVASVQRLLGLTPWMW